MDKTAEYLRLLQEKNRLKKMMATKSKDEQAKEELEKGFTTHFQGAHATKDSKMPVQTKVTANVKPLNIMGRFAKSANLMWGGEKKSDAVSPTKNIEDENEKLENVKVDRMPLRTEREESNYYSEYESDFDEASDAETDFKPNGANSKDKRGLQMPPLTEEDDDVFVPHNRHPTSELDRGKGSSLSQSVALDATLQTRVKDLSAQQKLKLLKLLEQDLQQESSAASPVIAHVQTFDLTADAEGHSTNAGGADHTHVADEQRGANTRAQPLLVSSEEHSISVRVRITSAWSSKAKFVSLGAVRLRAAPPTSASASAGERMGSDSVDLIPLLAVKAFSGLTLLPAGSECVRTLPQLLGGAAGSSAARRPASAYRGPPSSAWKGPISLDCPLELQFAGDLSGELLGSAGLENLQLLVWNCETAPLNSSGARDVDVFIGGKCVWSGQLEEGSGDDANFGAVGSAWGGGRPGELRPALAIFPFRTENSKQDEKRGSDKGEDHHDFSKPVSLEPQKDQKFGNAPQSPIRNSLVNAGKPDWLVQQQQQQHQGQGQVRRIDGDLFGDNYALPSSPQRRAGSRGTSRRQNTFDQQQGTSANPATDTSVAESLHTFGSPKKRVSAAGKRVSSALAKSVEGDDSLQNKVLLEEESAAAFTAGISSGDAVAKRRAARRERNLIMKDTSAEDYGERDSVIVSGGFSPDRSATSKKMREDELKRSIDSMAFNDKFNLGRLSASKLPFARSTVEGVGEETGEDEDQRLVEITGTLDDSLDRPTTPLLVDGVQKSPAKLLSSPQRRINRNNSAPLGLSTVDGAARAARDSDRTAKIDLVQEKITSTIADLAKIMSGIPTGGISLGRADASSTSRDSPSAGEQPALRTPPRGGKGSIASEVETEPTLHSSPQKSSGTEKTKVKAQTEVKPWHKKEKEKEQITNSGAKATLSATTVSSPHTLVLEIDSNWGDANYVGMNGVELYDRSGRLIQLSGAGNSLGGVRAITAFPRDLADLPQHKDDPRKVHNLLNGVNFTKNDLHSWLTPHIQLLKRAEGETPSAVATLPYLARVVMELEAGVVPAMCRLFNYNRSRTRNQRGVRHFKLILDDIVQFEGDLQKASGQLQAEESECEVLFLDSSLSESDKAELRSHLTKRERYGGAGAEGAEEDDEELGEASGDGDLDALEQSWAELSVARPSTSTGVVPPPAQSAGPVEDPHSASKGEPEQRVSSAASAHYLTAAFSSYAAVSADPTPSVSAGVISNPATAAVDRVEIRTDAGHGNPFSLAEQTRGSIDKLAPAGEPRHALNVLPSGKNVTSSRMMVSASCKILRLDLQSTWGDASYIGLCGLEVLVGSDFAPARIGIHQLRAQPKDLTEIGCYDDPRVLSNLLNGVNNTADDTAMWIIPFTSGSEHFIEIDLLKVTDVVGIRVWNYNKSTEQVLRGCRQLAISADGRPLCQCILRMGPGSDGVSFGQTILFCEVADIMQGVHPQYAPHSRLRPGQQKETRLTSYMSPAIRQDFETPLSPTGLLWKFTFFDNWNDGYYIGLDAVEFFDPAGRLIDAAALGTQIQAVPYSVGDLAPPPPPHQHQQQQQEDLRVPSQLFQKTRSGRPQDCWLAPLSRCMTPAERAACVRRVLRDRAATNSPAGDPLGSSGSFFPLNNVLYVLFQHPVAVSAIKLYNYSKTPTRGVRDFQIEVDGLYLYMGSLLRADKEKTTPHIINKATSASAAGGPSSEYRSPAAATAGTGISRGQSVLFTNDPKILQAHKDTVTYCGAGEQDLLCINERQVMVRSKNMYDTEPPNTSLEGVRADLDKRPMTAAAWK